MSLWQRFKRALRSIFGGWVSEMEDPALILEQNIRDMRDKIPKMNENIAMLRANAKMIEKE
ncbi:MAG TPA: PspA/IM30 family protein, partial [Turneriella sp.]|nr:PspA/IM30 family protein [Turneriella sp.]